MTEISRPAGALAPAETERMTPAARRTIVGAFFGFFVDMFDVYLPVVALTPALAYFQPKTLPKDIATTFFYIVFAVTLVGRPIGATIFGHFGDRIGRQRTTMIAVGGFAVVTLAIALLPGYSTLGIGAMVLLVLLRLLDGIFLGGEYTAATPLAMEYCPKRLRGFFSALVQSGYPVAYVAISIVTLITLRMLPAGALGSPYVQYGWRIPFIFGSLIAFLFLLYFRSVPESPAWESAEKTSESPLMHLFRGEQRARFLQIFVVMTGFWLSLNAVVSTLPLVLKAGGMTATTITYLLLVANIALFAGYLLFGLIGQVIGRRPTLILLGLAVAVVCSALYVWVVDNAKTAVASGSLGTLVLIVAVIVTLTVCGWGQLGAYISERFPTQIRSSGFGVGYSLAAILPAFYSFVMLWMGQFMPYKYTHIVLLVLAGLLIAVGAALGPETKQVDLREEDLSRMGQLRRPEVRGRPGLV
ncbi:MAG TPA: MFS transporter [Candidatus Dormibacteraeota bacterium]